MNWKVSLYAGVALLGAIFIADVASAQVAASATVEDVVVTARRREESLQSTPVAVSAFSEASLERQQVTDFKDLNLGSPNVTIVNNTGTTTGLQVYIRGVGQDDSSFTSESAVALYIDGVFIGREIGGLTDLFDVAGVEVLRGPQGTLYGRNSSGGAIKYSTKRPNLTEGEGALRISGGSYNKLDIAGVLSAPLVVDKLALRLSAKARREDGFLTQVNGANVQTGKDLNAVDQQAARLSLEARPAEDWRVFATLDYFRDQSGPQAITGTNCAGLNGALVHCPLLFGSPYRAASSAPDINKHTQWGTQATVNYDGLPWAGLQSVTAYRTFSDDLALDLSGNPAGPLLLLQFLNQKQFSQELTLTSSGDGPLSWTAGAFYFREDIDQDATFTGARNVDSQRSTSYAVFGDLRYTFGGGFSAFAGLRYTDDDKTLNRSFANPSTRPVVGLGTGGFKDTQTTPRLGVEWQATPDLFLYATFAKGYKPGGFANARPASAVGALGTFGSETVASYEAGIRTSWLNNRLTANLTIFKTENDNLSQSVLTATSFSVVSGDAEIKGAEFEGRWSAAEGLHLYVVGGLLDTEWVKRPPAAPPGAKLKHAPENHVKAGFDYTRSLGTGGYDLYLAGNVAHASEIYRSVANTVNIRSAPYTVADAQIGVGPADGAWKISLSGQNLGDEVYWEQGVSTLGRYYARPRTWAVTLDAKF